MALTRSFLKGYKLDEDVVESIIAEHVSVVDALKKERDGYKAEAEKAADIQKELDGIKGGEDWKKKYEDEKKAFDDFKKKTADDAEAAKVRAAYRKLLIEEKIGEKRVDTILKVTDFSKMKLDKDGNLENVDALRKSIGEEWGEFKTTVTTKGADVDKPPHTDKSKMTKEEILKIEDTSARQKAIAENLDLFQKG